MNLLKNYFRLLVLLGGLFLSTQNVFAQKIALIEFETSEYDYLKLSFDSNPELERSWVKIEAFKSDPSGDVVMPAEFRVKVEGLSFNKKDSSIQYQEPTSKGKIITCGYYQVKGKGFFKRDKWVDSKLCVFKNIVFSKEYDDGFTIQKKEMIRAYLEIK